MLGLFGLSVSLRCFAFAELPWYQRKVAAIIFASPPTSTYEEVRAELLLSAHVSHFHRLILSAILPHFDENFLFCHFQALEFFLKAEEGKTAHFKKEKLWFL